MEEKSYILLNECMHGLVKIERTTCTVEERMRELYTTGVPYPFNCFYAAVVQDAEYVEKKLHDAFGDHCVSTNRECFKIAPHRIKAAIELVAFRAAHF